MFRHLINTHAARIRVRRFENSSHAAIENGESRVYAGIHLVDAVTDGYRQGAGIGRAIAHLLPPVH
jgi:hypothetical protein